MAILHLHHGRRPLCLPGCKIHERLGWPMIVENQRLVANEPAELWEITGWSSRLQEKYRSYLRNLYNIPQFQWSKNRRMSTCNRLDFDRSNLESEPVMPHNLPDHWADSYTKWDRPPYICMVVSRSPCCHTQTVQGVVPKGGQLAKKFGHTIRMQRQTYIKHIGRYIKPYCGTNSKLTNTF